MNAATIVGHIVVALIYLGLLFFYSTAAYAVLAALGFHGDSLLLYSITMGAALIWASR